MKPEAAQTNSILIALDPVDREHLRHMAALTPGQRMLAMAEVSAFQRGMLRGLSAAATPIYPSRRSTC